VFVSGLARPTFMKPGLTAARLFAVEAFHIEAGPPRNTVPRELSVSEGFYSGGRIHNGGSAFGCMLNRTHSFEH